MRAKIIPDRLLHLLEDTSYFSEDMIVFMNIFTGKDGDYAKYNHFNIKELTN